MHINDADRPLIQPEKSKTLLGRYQETSFWSESQKKEFQREVAPAISGFKRASMRL